MLPTSISAEQEGNYHLHDALRTGDAYWVHSQGGQGDAITGTLDAR